MPDSEWDCHGFRQARQEVAGVDSPVNPDKARARKRRISDEALLISFVPSAKAESSRCLKAMLRISPPHFGHSSGKSSRMVLHDDARSCVERKPTAVRPIAHRLRVCALDRSMASRRTQQRPVHLGRDSGDGGKTVAAGLVKPRTARAIGPQAPR